MAQDDDKQTQNPRLPAGKPGTAENAPPEAAPEGPKKPAKEFGGPAGPEPTRYGDWECHGRVSDF